MSAGWTLADMPDLTGRRAVVTGVTAGLGTRTAVELARAGAEVVLVARSAARLTETADRLARELPEASFQRVLADLADLSSVRAGAAQIAALGPLDLLVNNAGVMALPYARTVDGFELQLATNHLGHFLLTGLLLPGLVASGHGRVVTLGSVMHRVARRVPVDDPRTERRRYSRWGAYGESKLATIMTAFELDRRLRDRELPVRALAAHPGYSATELVRKTGGPASGIMDAATKVVAQPAEYGALPTLMAATADLPGGTYVGPRNLGQLSGLPRVVRAGRLAYDEAAAARLWEVSEAATGISYP